MDSTTPLTSSGRRTCRWPPSPGAPPTRRRRSAESAREDATGPSRRGQSSLRCGVAAEHRPGVRLSAEPCPPSVLWSFHSALVFLRKVEEFSKAGNCRRTPRSRRPLRSSAHRWPRTRRSSGGRPRGWRSQWCLRGRRRLLTRISWPTTVCTRGGQCVRVWSSLRFDDHRGLVPCAMSMEAGNFKAIPHTHQDERAG